MPKGKSTSDGAVTVTMPFSSTSLPFSSKPRYITDYYLLQKEPLNWILYHYLLNDEFSIGWVCGVSVHFGELVKCLTPAEKVSLRDMCYK